MPVAITSSSSFRRPGEADSTIQEATAEDQNAGSITLDLHGARECDDLSADTCVMVPENPLLEAPSHPTWKATRP